MIMSPIKNVFLSIANFVHTILIVFMFDNIDYAPFIWKTKRVKKKKMSGFSGKNDPIRGGRFHCVVGNFADAPKLLPNGLIELWRTNFVKVHIFWLNIRFQRIWS